jgi:hypothetical protein
MVMAAAIDRLVHHNVILELNIVSNRMSTVKKQAEESAKWSWPAPRSPVLEPLVKPFAPIGSKYPPIYLKIAYLDPGILIVAGKEKYLTSIRDSCVQDQGRYRMQ